MVNRICPTCKRNVSLTHMQWDLGAELPLDCPWCNKSKTEKKTAPKRRKKSQIVSSSDKILSKVDITSENVVRLKITVRKARARTHKNASFVERRYS